MLMLYMRKPLAPSVCSRRVQFKPPADPVCAVELPANDTLAVTLRNAQSELEQEEATFLAERETMVHLNNAHEAMNNAIEEIARGIALLGRNSTCDQPTAAL